MTPESPQQIGGSVREPFELRLAMEPGDIDQRGHVNNGVYLRWVQDAAVAHWRVNTPALEQDRLHGVVTRHAIDYRRPALAGDDEAHGRGADLGGHGIAARI